MGALLDEIDRRASPVRCPIARILAGLDNQDAKDLAEAIVDPLRQASRIASVLRGRGIEVSDEALRRHRRKVTGQPGNACGCPRESQ